MIPTQAIEKAIEGGWRQFAPSDEPIRIDLTNNTWPMIWGTAPSGLAKGLPVAVVATDPAFWQALGKALGWGKGKYDAGDEYGEFEGYYWHFMARQFLDLILTGGDTEKYWNDLLA